MSLINNLLKDIQRRETNIHALPYIALTKTPAKRKSLNRLPLFVIATASSFLLVLLIFLLTPPASHSTLAPFINDQTLELSNPPIDPVFQEPVTITGVTLQSKQNLTELGFLLNHPALYRVISHNSRNEISIIIDHSQLQSNLPAFNYLNTALERIKTTNLANETRIDLYLVPGTDISYISSNTQGQDSQLVIGLQLPNSPVTPTQQASAGNKSGVIKIPDANSLLTQQYQQALNAAEKGEYDSALQQLENIVQSSPEFKEARVSLAALLLDQGFTDKAKQVIAKGLELSPGYPGLIELRARLLTLNGKLKEALTYLQMNPPSITDNPQYHAFIAALYEQTNQYLPAFKLYRQLLQLDDTNSYWWMGLGISLEKLGRPNSAAAAYGKALEEGNLDLSAMNFLQNRLQSLRGDANEKG